MVLVVGDVEDGTTKPANGLAAWTVHIVAPVNARNVGATSAKGWITFLGVVCVGKGREARGAKGG